MSGSNALHCRLCATIRPIGKLINLESDNIKGDEIVKKLTRLSVNFTSIFEGNILPKTVCLICLDSLDRAYDFVENVDQAQQLLSNVKREECISDDDYTELSENKPVKDEPEEYPIVKSKKSMKKQSSQGKSPLSWEDYNWVCAKCGTEFPSIEEFRSHSMMYHECCNAFKCTDCDKKMLRLDKFVLHVKRHRKYLKLSCYICNSKFSSAHIARAHKNIHLFTEHICSGCNLVFANSEDLNKHIKLYYKSRSGNSIAVLDTSNSLTCVLCKKTFKNKGCLNGHLLVHVQRTQFPKQREHICDRCGKSYFNKADLAAHSVTHDEARPFQCDICKSNFKTIIRLKAHVKVHNDLKPYVCSQCGRHFRLSKQLRSHEIIHTDSLPFACPYCSKAFRFKSILNLHLRQHTGVQPYTCEMCQRKFTNWSNYNKHMKRRHGTSMVKRKVKNIVIENPVENPPPVLEKIG